MMITTTFKGLIEKWIEQEVETGVYNSPQELVRAAVRKLREQSLTNQPSEELTTTNPYGSLLDEIPGREINVKKDYRVPVGAKAGSIIEFTFHQLPPEAKIKITAKVPGYSRTYKDTPWFVFEKSAVKSTELHRSSEHPNRWIIHLPPQKKEGELEVYVIDFQKIISKMEGCEQLAPRSLSTIRFQNLPSDSLKKVRIFGKK